MQVSTRRVFLMRGFRSMEETITPIMAQIMDDAPKVGVDSMDMEVDMSVAPTIMGMTVFGL